MKPQDMLDAIQQYPMCDALSKVGITKDYLAEKLKSELIAKEEKVFHQQGIVYYSKKMIAWSIRQKAREDAQKLLGLYPEKTLMLKNDPDDPIIITVRLEDGTG